MTVRNLSRAISGDPAVRRAMETFFGKSDAATIASVLTDPVPVVVSKATMVAAPKMAKKMIAKPKAAPLPKPPSAPPPPAAPSVAQAAPAPGVVKKEDWDFAVNCEFAKFDEDERTVFGWASITEQDGMPVVDRQGDTIDSHEMAKAAYDYVIDSRKGGHQHQRTQDGEPLQVSDMIESMVFTPEKIEKMGLPPDTPIGWWVGYKVRDDEIWKAVKSGEITGLSIHGRGKRTPVA